MSKPITIYNFSVDGHRRPSRRRNTRGQYLVAASSEKEATKLLRDAIRFGSIQLLESFLPWDGMHSVKERPCRLLVLGSRLRRGDVYEVTHGTDPGTGNDLLGLGMPRSCCDPIRT